jgi:hypothetical protein
MSSGAMTSGSTSSSDSGASMSSASDTSTALRFGRAGPATRLRTAGGRPLPSPPAVRIFLYALTKSAVSPPWPQRRDRSWGRLPGLFPSNCFRDARISFT